MNNRDTHGRFEAAPKTIQEQAADRKKPTVEEAIDATADESDVP